MGHWLNKNKKIIIPLLTVLVVLIVLVTWVSYPYIAKMNYYKSLDYYEMHDGYYAFFEQYEHFYMFNASEYQKEDFLRRAKTIVEEELLPQIKEKSGIYANCGTHKTVLYCLLPTGELSYGSEINEGNYSINDHARLSRASRMKITIPLWASSFADCTVKEIDHEANLQEGYTW